MNFEFSRQKSTSKLCNLVDYYVDFLFQKALTYTCDREGNVICQHGWTDIDSLCSQPICNFGQNGTTIGCDHGICVEPQECACDIGWEGARCEICLPLPGCKHGYCQNQAFECICKDENSWQGAHCNERKCHICFLKRTSHLPLFLWQLCAKKVASTVRASPPENAGTAN